MSQEIRRTVHFSGRVQGVGFRETTRRIAAEHPVAGFVQNLADGRVRLVIEGSPAALTGFVEAVSERLRENIEQREVVASEASGEFGPAAPGTLRIRR